MQAEAKYSFKLDIRKSYCALDSDKAKAVALLEMAAKEGMSETMFKLYEIHYEKSQSVGYF